MGYQVQHSQGVKSLFLTDLFEGQNERHRPSAGSLRRWQAGAGSQEFMQVAHVRAGAQGLGPPHAAFAGASAEPGRKWSGCQKRWLPLLHRDTSPQLMSEAPRRRGRPGLLAWSSRGASSTYPLLQKPPRVFCPS